MILENITLNNLDEVMVLAERSHSESVWTDYAFDLAFCKQTVGETIGKEGHFSCVCRQEGELVGYFVASLGRSFFNKAFLAIENGVYVTPEARGGPAAFLMYKKFAEWCKMHNAESLVHVYFAEDNEKTYAFFKKVGMRECGKIFRGSGR